MPANLPGHLWGGTSLSPAASQKAALLPRASSTTAHISSETVKKAADGIFSAASILLQAVNGTNAPARWTGNTEKAGERGSIFFQYE